MIRAISSKDRPLVSGTRKNTKRPTWRRLKPVVAEDEPRGQSQHVGGDDRELGEPFSRGHTAQRRGRNREQVQRNEARIRRGDPRIKSCSICFDQRVVEPDSYQNGQKHADLSIDGISKRRWHAPSLQDLILS